MSETETNVTDVVSPDHAQHLRLLEALIFAGTQALDEKELATACPTMPTSAACWPTWPRSMPAAA